MKKGFNRAKCFWFPLVAIALLFILSAIVMLLWNAVIPEVTGARYINYWQAMAIFLLSKILFGIGKKDHGNRPGFWWKRGLEQKMKHMDPEERAKFKEEMIRRMRCWGPANPGFSGSCEKPSAETGTEPGN